MSVEIRENMFIFGRAGLPDWTRYSEIHPARINLWGLSIVFRNWIGMISICNLGRQSIETRRVCVFRQTVSIVYNWNQILTFLGNRLHIFLPRSQFELWGLVVILASLGHSGSLGDLFDEMGSKCGFSQVNSNSGTEGLQLRSSWHELGVAIWRWVLVHYQINTRSPGSRHIPRDFECCICQTQSRRERIGTIARSISYNVHKYGLAQISFYLWKVSSHLC